MKLILFFISIYFFVGVLLKRQGYVTTSTSSLAIEKDWEKERDNFFNGQTDRVSYWANIQ